MDEGVGVGKHVAPALDRQNRNNRWHTLFMLKKTRITLLPAAVVAVALASAPTGHAAVGQMLNMLPSGGISCDQAANHWTSDADYQAKVAQAQAIAAMDPRGNEILAALGRVDAAAEQCGLKGTTGGSAGGNAGSGTPAGAGEAGGSATTSDPDSPTGSNGAGASGGGGGGSASGSAENGGSAAPARGSGGTADAPVTDAESILGPIRDNPATPMRTIEVLGQGQIEVADADAMMSNFLRQFTIIV
ncbi:hypothetical protein CFAEC_00340 [Corynebacterium faecale]|nr:hypothetical protein CFAEC_00340 [Corynebacterium faecale]